LLDIGKLAIAREWVKLSEVKTMVQELIERATLGAHKYAITLSSSVEVDAEREAEIDMLRIKIILENLVENAIQYTRGSVRTIHVDVHSTENDLVMSVKDSGIGIPADEQSKIFSEFYRAQNARKELASGSGIGLYLCAEYVRAHHGTIRFESQVNQGTTFFVTIPLKTRADVEEFLKKV
jgi:signal transduction histidine kinase